MQVRVFDNVVVATKQRQIYEFLTAPGWVYGWKSQPQRDLFAFWHKHFAGATSADHEGVAQYDCAEELKRVAPLLHGFWEHLNKGVLAGHVLTRCYANATPYGADGTLHTDTINPDGWTSIYYPHERWSPSWGGETVIFNKEESDIIGTCYPKPNRLFVFPGIMPHVGRGVARICPVMRVILVYKTLWSLPATKPS